MYIIIVLGNSVEFIWKKRVIRGVEYYKFLKNKYDPEIDNPVKIVFSGTCIQAVKMKDYAVDELGVNIKDAILENHSTNTYENIIFTRNILEKAGYFKPTFMTVYNFIICTTQFHISRATLIALDQLGDYGKISSIFSLDEENIDPELYNKEKEFTYQYLKNFIMKKTLIQ